MGQARFSFDPTFARRVKNSDEAEAMLRRAVERGEAEARRLCPYDENNNTPGHIHLRDTIYSDVVDGQGVVGATADHASHVEYGTYKMDAQPFLRPSMGAAMRGE